MQAIPSTEYRLQYTFNILLFGTFSLLIFAFVYCISMVFVFCVCAVVCAQRIRFFGNGIINTTMFAQHSWNVRSCWVIVCILIYCLYVHHMQASVHQGNIFQNYQSKHILLIHTLANIENAREWDHGVDMNLFKLQTMLMPIRKFWNSSKY